MSGTNVVGVTSNDDDGRRKSECDRVADFNTATASLISSRSISVRMIFRYCSTAVRSPKVTTVRLQRRPPHRLFSLSAEQVTWYVSSLNSSAAVLKFAAGRPTRIVPADYDGDRLTDFAYFRPESGLWFILDINGRPMYFIQFGSPGDIPMPADYDGDGRADLAVFRPSDGNWYIRRSTNNSLQVTHFGASGDKPAAADFDGDGIDDVTVFPAIDRNMVLHPKFRLAGRDPSIWDKRR
jgi:hypothetical protein